MPIVSGDLMNAIAHKLGQRITDGDRLAASLQMVPYLPGGSDWAGMDCWGCNELWYANRFGIALDDRLGIEPGAEGIEEGFGDLAAHGWNEASEPRDDDTVIMRHVVIRDVGGKRTRKIIEHGHCGIFWRGQVLHADGRRQIDEDGSDYWIGGCRLEPFDKVAGRVTAVLRRTELA